MRKVGLGQERLDEVLSYLKHEKAVVEIQGERRVYRWIEKEEKKGGLL